MYDAVLFDLDGTLLDTPDAIASTLHEVLAETGRDVDDGEIRATIGRPLSESLARLLRRGVEHPEVGEAVTRYRRLFDGQVAPRAADLVYPGVRRALARLRADGTRLAVVTSKSKLGADGILHTADLLDVFDTVIGSDLTEHAKPHADPALLAARQLAVTPANCVVVGDAVVDIEMALAAGMAAYGVTTGVGSAEQLRAAGAVSVADSLPDLLAADSPIRAASTNRAGGAVER